MPATDSTAFVEAVFRIEFPRVVATLAAFVGDIGLAEDLAQDALVDALRQWPRDGTPRNPGAWLTTVGKRKAVDLFRRNRTLQREVRPAGPRAPARGRARPADGGRGPRSGIAGGDRRRPPPPDVRVVPSRSSRVPARTALTLRLIGWPHGARDRSGLRGARADHRAAHRPGQEDDRRGRRRLRGPVRRRSGVSAGLGAPGHLPHLQRGLLGHLRGGLAAARALRRSPPAGPGARRPGARGTRGLWPSRV